MRRSLALAFMICFIATTGFAQSRFNGKWATDRTANSLDATRRENSTRLELEVDGAKASGTVSLGGLGGEFEVLKDGKVDGNKIQFITIPSGNPQAQTTWIIEMLDDNTVTLRRSTDLPMGGTNVLNLNDVARFAAQATPSQTPAPTASAPLSIEGRVEDLSRALIPGVGITATSIQTGAVTSTMTNEAGVYRFAGLNPGPYRLSASLSGFQNQTRDLPLNANTPARSNFTMEIAVRALAPCVQNSFACGVLRRVQ